MPCTKFSEHFGFDVCLENTFVRVRADPSSCAPRAGSCPPKFEDLEARARCSKERRSDRVVGVFDLPRKFAAAEVMRFLDEQGFASKYDVVVMPSRQNADRLEANCGFCFIHLTCPDVADAARLALNGSQLRAAEQRVKRKTLKARFARVSAVLRTLKRANCEDQAVWTRVDGTMQALSSACARERLLTELKA